MEELNPKFIIETDDEFGDCLIIGKCILHRELANDINNVKGGGWFKINHENDTIVLYGKSEEFGYVNISDVEKCIENGNVFNNKYLTHSIANNYKFDIKQLKNIN